MTTQGVGSVDFFEAVASRHSIRSFSGKPVPQEAIEKLLGAAATAPSAFNSQPWHFYVTRGESREKLGRIMSQSTQYLEEYIEVLGPEKYEFALRWYSDLGGAPVVIVCTSQAFDTEHENTSALVAVGAAIQNMLVGAAALGLGACNISFAHYVQDEIVEEFDIPKDREIVSIIAVGYPSDQPAAAPPHDSDVADYLD